MQTLPEQDYPTSRLLAQFNCDLCSQPIPVGAFLTACQSVLGGYRTAAAAVIVAKKATDKMQRKAILEKSYRASTVLDRLVSYLSGKKHVTLSEQWAADFCRPLPASIQPEARVFLTDVVDTALLPQALVNRRLLPHMVWQRWERDRRDFSPDTLAALAWTETHLCHLKRRFAYGQASQPGARLNRAKTLGSVDTAKRITRLKTLLHVTGRRDLRDLTRQDIDTYLGQHGDSGKKLAKEMINVFANLVDGGHIPCNPLDGLWLGDVPQYQKFQFVAKDDMDRILSASDKGTTLLARRDRMMVLVGYDLGAREGELRGLLRSDIADVNGKLMVTFRADNQKGRKAECPLPVYHSSVADELRAYMRELDAWMAERNRTAPYPLFPGLTDGGHMRQGRLSSRITDYFRKAGIKTYYGQDVTAHVLRHTMATLYYAYYDEFANITVLSERLRHESIDVTKRIYINDKNPLIRRERAERHPTEQNGAPASATAFGGKTPEQFIEWAISTLGANPTTTLAEVARLGEEQRLQSQQAAQRTNGYDMPESEAFTVLRGSGVKTMTAFREFFVSRQWAIQQAGCFVYDRSRVWEFAASYVSKDTLLKDAQTAGKMVSRRTVFRRLATMDHVVIGKTILIPKDVAAKLLA